MVKTLGGKLVKALSVILAAVLLAGCLAFAACTGSHPEIEMRITFNGEEYTLTYRLYRNYYRQTVDHYMDLIEAGFFDGTVINDYQSDRMIGGGYRYEGDGDELIPLDYDAATTDENGNVTLRSITVWEDADRTVATNRLHGEIAGNGFSVEDGGLTNTLGALGTYTYVNSSEKKQMTYLYSSVDGYGQSEYYKNSFTSLFYICTRANASVGNYCVFGELADDASEDAFDDLRDAIEAYIEDQELDSFTEPESDVRIYDEYVDGGSYNVDFAVPVEPIVIETIRVTKY